MRGVAAAAAILTLAFGASFASGAEVGQRFAAPNGSGLECTQQAPCTLKDAVTGAGAEDEVIVFAGDYTVTGGPLNVTSPDLFLHGDFAGPMPRVSAKLGGQPAIGLNEAGGRLSYLEVTNEAGEGIGVRCLAGTTVERVHAIGIGEGAAGLNARAGCTVRNSLLEARGTNALGMESLGIGGSSAGTASNLTAIAVGTDSAGIQSRYSDTGVGSHTLTLTNSIVEGASDLRTEDSEGPGRIVVSNSNFDTVKAETEGAIGGAANQSTAPIFVDALSGDFRPAAGSVTIDAGAAGELGALDLAGNPRVLGTAPDIGAYEFVPPAAGAITALAVSPRKFRPRKNGDAIAAAKRKAKMGATVTYSLSAAATVEFTVERALKGRRVGGKCKKPTRANRTKKRCTRFVAVRGAAGFSHQGAAGKNAFGFSGRLARKGRVVRGPLAPGKYRLVGRAGDSTKTAPFRIVR